MGMGEKCVQSVCLTGKKFILFIFLYFVTISTWKEQEQRIHIVYYAILVY